MLKLKIFFVLLLASSLCLYFLYHFNNFDQKGLSENFESVDTRIGQATYYNNKYGVKFIYPADWSIYDDTNPQNGEVVDILIMPVKSGEPWGDSFYSSFQVIENYGTYEKWKEEYGTVPEDRIADYISLVNETYGENLISRNDFTVATELEEKEGRYYSSTLELLDCPTGPSCMFFGFPTGYSKTVSFYDKGNVFLFYVTTYSSSDNAEIFDEIVDSVSFMR